MNVLCVSPSENYSYARTGSRAQKIRDKSARVRYQPGLDIRTGLRLGHRVQIIYQHAWQIRQDGVQPVQVSYKSIALNNQPLLESDGNGQPIDREIYYPFGGTAHWTARRHAYKIRRYAGKERDATGLISYGFRYYASWLFRWLNPDPAGCVDGLNLWYLCRNNPITWGDRDGRMVDPEDNAAPSTDVLHDVLTELGIISATVIVGQPVEPRVGQQPSRPCSSQSETQLPILASTSSVSDWALSTENHSVDPALQYTSVRPSLVEGWVACTYCKTSLPQYKLASHLRLNCAKKPLLCGVEGCSKRFITQRTLSAHQVSHHVAGKMHLCDYADCHKRFHTRSDLRRHQTCHQDEKRFACKYSGCNARFTNQQGLANHQPVHWEHSSFACDWPGCNKAYRQQSSLSRHKTEAGHRHAYL